MPAEEVFQPHASTSEAWFRENLRLLVEQRTVSPGRTDDRDIIAGANVARDLMARCGAQAELVETAGTPTIMGVFRHPAPRARILVYNHFDVQPADSRLWKQPDPFRFEVEPHPQREFLYRGRGTTDDKGPALCALRAAAAIAQQRLPIEVVLLWETEEEIGSPHFTDVISARREQLACDGVIVSDTIWPSDVQPAISWGLRGSLHALLRMRTGEKEMHSGLTGGVARNPIKELARLSAAIEMASFWKNSVAPLDDEEALGYAQSGFDPAYFRRAHAVEKLETDIPLEMLIRLWARPTYEVHGIVGGYQGAGLKTIIPHEAEMKISFRLVPDQEPEKIAIDLRSFVRAMNPDVELEIVGSLSPYQSTRSGPIYEAICTSIEEAFGRPPVSVREGGSIGAVPILARELGVDVHFLPLSLPEHGYHAPNEYFDWKQARCGMAAFHKTFEILAGA